jgi:hydroxymethylglutaryl-CoA reductase
MTADAAFGYAPGKIILFGEHAVVYGLPAIAATLDRGVRIAVTARPDRDGPVLRGHGMGLTTLARPDPQGEGPESLRAALARLVELCGERVRGLTFSVDGAIPAGSGLGSSAALAVAMLRGVRRFFDEPALAPDELVEQAFALERVFHGTPSGVDHTVIARGGAIYFTRHGALDASATGTSTVEDLIVPRRMRFVVGLAGPHAGTAHAVASLRDRARRHPALYERLFDDIGMLAKEGRRLLLDGSYAAVGELMDLNQGYLNALGVSTPGIEALCAIARERGALGAKLTGAGGGGAVIALVDDDPEPVVRAFQAAGYTAFGAVIEATDTERSDATGPAARGA